MAVGGRTDHRFGTDIAPGARSVLNDEWLAKPVRQPLGDQTRENIRTAASGLTDDQANRTRREGLRPGDRGHGNERASTRCRVADN